VPLFDTTISLGKDDLLPFIGWFHPTGEGLFTGHCGPSTWAAGPLRRICQRKCKKTLCDLVTSLMPTTILGCRHTS